MDNNYYPAISTEEPIEFYDTARFTIGSRDGNLLVKKDLNADERAAAYKKDYPYVHIFPCDHKNADEYGLCPYCWHHDYPVTYIERSWDDVKVVDTEATSPRSTADFPESRTVEGGWYYLSRDITINDRVSLTGDTHLILGDGRTLDVEGIYVPKGSTLTIYSQSDGENSGKIISKPTEGGAGIGATSNNHPGGNIVIHGGKIIAEGDSHCAGIGSNDGNGSDTGSFTMYGGNVTATGGSQGAGFGGGRDCDGGTITIYGGTVNATGKDSSAGIGGSDASGSRADNSTIYIYGGKVTATGNSKGAGIGGGEYGSAVIEISGGEITATGGATGGAGIGSGADGTGSHVSITGGVTNATAKDSDADAIGDGKNSYHRTETMSVVAFDYSDNTRDSISITINDTIKCNLKLSKDFKNESTGEVYEQGSHNFTSGLTLVASDNSPVLTIKGVTGSFNDKIKLNFYFLIPESVRSDQGAYVTITNDRTGQKITQSVIDAEYFAGKGYRFSIPLAAKEASDTITARVFNGQGAITIKGNLRSDYTETGVQSSLMEYFTWLENSEETTKAEKDLGAAAKDYCSAAQIYFGYHADNLNLSDALDAVTAGILSQYESTRKGTLPAGVSISGISAMLESDNTFRLYYNFSDGEPSGLTFKIDGNDARIIRRSDGRYYLALTAGVYSNHLQDVHTYSVSDGKDTYTITASVLTYARSCAIKKGTGKAIDNERNIGKALYLYNRAAVAAFGK